MHNDVDYIILPLIGDIETWYQSVKTSFWIAPAVWAWVYTAVVFCADERKDECNRRLPTHIWTIILA